MKLYPYEYYDYIDDNQAVPLDMSSATHDDPSDPANKYCLRWHNHRGNLLSAFEYLLHQPAFADVSIGCENGVTLHAHRLLLAASSPYFDQLLHQQPTHHHPIIILKDVQSSVMNALLRFMYCGEVNVDRRELGAFLTAARMLKIKGLQDSNTDELMELTPTQTHPIPLVTSNNRDRSRSATPVSSMPMECRLTPNTPEENRELDCRLSYPRRHPFSPPPSPLKRGHHRAMIPENYFRLSSSPPPSPLKLANRTMPENHPKHSASPPPLHYPFIHSPRLSHPSHFGHHLPPTPNSGDDPKDLRTSKEANGGRPSRPASTDYKDVKPSTHLLNSYMEATSTPKITHSPSVKRPRNSDANLLSPPPPPSLLRNPLVHPSNVSTLVSLANSMMGPIAPIGSHLMPLTPTHLSLAGHDALNGRDAQDAIATSVRPEAVAEWMEKRMELLQQDTSPHLPSSFASTTHKSEPISGDERTYHSDTTNRDEDSQEKFNLGSLMPPDFSHGYSLDPSSQMGSYGGCVAPKPEWKRYKQYSKSDLMDSIEAVKGGMTALMASRKFKVPSRTLYDKIKKMGINTVPRRIPGRKTSNITDIDHEASLNLNMDNKMSIIDQCQVNRDNNHSLKDLRHHFNDYKSPLYALHNIKNLKAVASSDEEASINGQKRPHSHDGAIDSKVNPNDALPNRPLSVESIIPLSVESFVRSSEPLIPLTILDKPTAKIRVSTSLTAKYNEEEESGRKVAQRTPTPTIIDSMDGSFLMGHLGHFTSCETRVDEAMRSDSRQQIEERA